MVTEELEKLKKAEELIREITYKDIDTDKIWLSHVFCLHGFLRDAIRELESGKIRRHSDRL